MLGTSIYDELVGSFFFLAVPRAGLDNIRLARTDLTPSCDKQKSTHYLRDSYQSAIVKLAMIYRPRPDGQGSSPGGGTW